MWAILCVCVYIAPAHLSINLLPSIKHHDNKAD